MVSRREALSAGIVGGLGAAMAPRAMAGDAPSPASDGGGLQDNSAELGRIADQLRSIEAELRNQRDTSVNQRSDAVEALRRAMRPHFRANRRFPVYIEVGLGIWIGVYDWHVGTRQPLAVSELPDGRYTLRLMQTTLILRPDVEDGYISTPFDELVGQAAPAPAAMP